LHAPALHRPAAKPFAAAPHEPALLEAAPPSAELSAELCALLDQHARRPSRHRLALFLVEQYDTIQAAAERYPRCPAWLFAAAALLETSGGQSEISQNSNNLFNLKARKDEVFAGRFYVDRKGVKWAKYSSYAASFDAFGCLVTSYNLDSVDAFSFAQSPYLAGYDKAKRDRYARRLLELVEMYNLKQIFKK
jgi:hypothetical protein